MGVIGVSREGGAGLGRDGTGLVNEVVNGRSRNLARYR